MLWGVPLDLRVPKNGLDLEKNRPSTGIELGTFCSGSARRDIRCGKPERPNLHTMPFGRGSGPEISFMFNFLLLRLFGVPVRGGFARNEADLGCNNRGGVVRRPALGMI